MSRSVIKVRTEDKNAVRTNLPAPLNSLIGFPAIFAAMRVAWDKLSDRQKVDCFKQSQETTVPQLAA